MTMAAKSEIEGSLVPLSKRQAMVMLEAGYLWMDLGNFDHARELLSGAALLMPKSEVPQLALGTLEFNRGAYDKALQAFRRAQSLAPRSALPRAHCGEALLFMGKQAEALRELKVALEQPDSDGGRLARELLELKARLDEQRASSSEVS
jgi:predicted Zn-dependent protease